MHGIILLLVLLGLAYLGSTLATRDPRGVHPLNSAATFASLGFALGPAWLGLIDSTALADFKAVAEMGCAWLALCAGISGGYRRAPQLHGAESLGKRGALYLQSIGVLLAFLEFGALAWVSHLLLLRFGFSELDAWLLSCGLSVVFSTSGVLRNSSSSSPGANTKYQLRVQALSQSRLLVPALGLTFILADAPAHGLVHFSSATRMGTNIAAGVALGLLATLLLGREPRTSERWGLIVGLCLLGSGAAIRVGISGVAVAFILGKVLYLSSSRREEFRVMVLQTEQAVLLPVALLAGAALTMAPVFCLLAVPLVILRILLAFGTGGLVSALSPGTLERPSFPLALAAGPSALTLAAGVELQQTLPEHLANSILSVCLCTMVLHQGARYLQRQQQGQGTTSDSPHTSSVGL